MPRVFALIAAASLLGAGGSRPAAEPVAFQDRFASYREGATPEEAWEMSGGHLVVRGGRLVSSEQGNITAVALSAPDAANQSLEAAVVPVRRTRPAGWSAVGLVLWADAGNYWRIALVESPGGQRYAELVECHNGVWQAQTETGTRLVSRDERGRGWVWSYGVPYRLRIALTPASITGEVRLATAQGGGEGEPVWRLQFELPPQVPAVRSGRLALAAVDMEAAFDDVLVTSPARVYGRRAARGRRYRIAVHQAGPRAAPYVAALKAAGFAPTALSSERVAMGGVLNTDRFDALLLPDGAECPVAAQPALRRFLRAGGDLVVVGGPLFEASRARAQAEWARRLQSARASRPVVELAGPRAPAWQHGTNNPQPRTTWRSEQVGPPAARTALRVEVGDLTGWDTLAAPAVGAFRPGDTLTLFWARGDAATPAMVVEWRERDGSRWIATVALSQEWRYHVLAPEDFAFWPDSASKGRGGPGDRLNPANVEMFSFGLAQSHSAIAPGRHVYWIAGLGTGRVPRGAARPDPTPPVLEMFSPFYKYYRLPSLRPTPEQLRAVAATGHQTGPVVVPIPRPRGLGFAGGRRGRWIPLADVRDTLGQWRGTAESLYVNLSLPYRGSVWGHIADTRPQVAAPSAVRMLRRLSRGLFLTRAGAVHFSYFTGEPVPLGAQVANLGAQTQTARVVLTVKRRGVAAPCYRRERPLRVDPGRTAQMEASWRAPARPGAYQVVTELVSGSATANRILQDVTVLPVPAAARDRFVTVRDGDFWAPAPGSAQEGRRVQWYPYGVNYWQSNVAGTDTAEYWLHWLAPSFYDPQVVERDLATLQRLGFTSVSIQLGNPDHVRQANDFVFRAGRRGIRTNLFIHGAHPFATDEALFTRLITEGRFAGNPNIWAYDIAWEHHLGGHDERRSWDREWEHWVIERYGTIEHAEANWGFPIPRDDHGQVTNPSDDQLRRDGPWLRLAAAYERCADDVISRRYARVIRKIRALDPNHLISARSASQPSWTGWFAYDMLSCGKHFDFSSPEGYGLQTEEAGFTVAYGRYAGNGKPVFWAEFGSSIFPYDTTGEKAAQQARLHRGFAQMLLDSGANGLASWWSVGGYRVDERSDFGIIAPDGTPRASALELQRLARRATSPRPPKRPTTWVTVDRDLHAAAYQALYDAHKHTYVEAVRAGGMVGVRTAGTGTTSATCPLVAVGNVPHDGFNPLKHLNAEFNRVEVRDASGAWMEAADGDVVQVAAGKPVVARVSAGNLGDAQWLAQAPTGAVRLVGDDRRDAHSSGLARLTFEAPLPGDVARYEDVTIGPFTVTPELRSDAEVVFTFEASGRARFGERRRVVLRAVTP